MTHTPDLPDLTSYRAVHHAIRLGARRLAAAAGTISPGDARRVRALQRYWTGYAAEVLVHHTLEDDVFFPALVERTPAMQEYSDRVSTDHHLLDELMAEVTDAVTTFAEPGAADRAAAALDRLSRLMDDHLDLEDVDILPLFVRHFTGEEYRELEEHAIAAIGIGRQAAFTVPFVLRSMSAEARVTTLATAPLPMRVLYRLTRRAHERLDRTVFAGTSVSFAQAVRS